MWNMAALRVRVTFPGGLEYFDMSTVSNRIHLVALDKWSKSQFEDKINIKIMFFSCCHR